jgi:hypothetical protein
MYLLSSTMQIWLSRVVSRCLLGSMTAGTLFQHFTPFDWVATLRKVSSSDSVALKCFDLSSNTIRESVVDQLGCCLAQYIQVQLAVSLVFHSIRQLHW